MACGDVPKVPDAALPDAYVPDSPSNVMCGAGEMNCNGTCANLMTSELYCGNCMTQCSPTQGCLNGTCVPANTSCARVRDLDPTAPDGVYNNPNTGGHFYCNFTAGVQHEIVTNAYTIAPGGFFVARATEFNDANFVKAFIALYNQNTGFRAFSTFTPTNCCMGPASGARYMFGGGNYLFTGMGTSAFCNTTIAAGTYVTFGRDAANYGAKLPDNYFQMFPYSETANCGDGNNVAFWYRRTTI